MSEKNNLSYKILDLAFQGTKNNIASYAIPIMSDGKEKWVLVESGPYSCHETLVRELGKHDIALSDIEKVFITHIHLDHSGGVWALAEAGASVYAHPFGTPHLIDPTKLYESAKRIYGEKTELLWSKVEPISADKVVAVKDGEVYDLVSREGHPIQVTAHHTPGHANHHIAWQMNQVLFAGDVCGVRLNEKVLEIPAPPPEFHLGTWLESLDKIRSLINKSKQGRVEEITLTHFGSYRDTEKLLYEVENRLQEIVAWFRGQVHDLAVEDWKIDNTKFKEFLKSRYRSQGLNEEEMEAIISITPPDMTVTGVLRYLKKFESST